MCHSRNEQVVKLYNVFSALSKLMLPFIYHQYSSKCVTVSNRNIIDYKPEDIALRYVRSKSWSVGCFPFVLIACPLYLSFSLLCLDISRINVPETFLLTYVVYLKWSIHMEPEKRIFSTIFHKLKCVSNLVSHLTSWLLDSFENWIS